MVGWPLCSFLFSIVSVVVVENTVQKSRYGGIESLAVLHGHGHLSGKYAQRESVERDTGYLQ